MAKKTISFDTPFRKGEKVTATVELPGVPEGTPGRVKVVNGMTWKRYWVFFDNGEHLGQVDQKALVRTRQWGEYQEHRTKASTAGATTTAATAAGGADAAAPAEVAGGGSRIPEHLLERTRNRRQALGLG